MHAVRVRSRHRGFTLIELLVVVVILGIVAGLGLPSFTEAITRNRLASNFNELIAGYSFARGEAIRRNADVELCAANAGHTDCQAAWGQNWMVWQDANGDGAVAAAEVLQVGGVSDGVTLLSTVSTHTRIRFSARGTRVFPAADPQLILRDADCPTGKPWVRFVRVGATGSLVTGEGNCT